MPRNVEILPTSPGSPREPMGLAPALLAKRPSRKFKYWCPQDIEFDPCCDEENPKTIIPKDVFLADAALKEQFPATPLVKSKCCDQLGLDVFYKLECFHKTHSFHERCAHYALIRLTENEKQDGIFTASLGNWGTALARRSQMLKIELTVVLPENTPVDTCRKIWYYGATPVMYGKTLAEAKRYAFILKNQQGRGTYINGYDHPHVIAAAGTIGIEILDQLPQTEAILVPIGGGALIAGIAAVVKERNPKVLIYGFEPVSCCCFYKAVKNERPYKTYNGFSIAGSLAVQTAGWNAYHTAISLIDKLVLAKDDWITQAILHLAEEDKMIVEGAGAISVSPMFTYPFVLPELLGKTVVCLISGSNVENYTLCDAIQRALAIEARKIKLTVELGAEDMQMRVKVLNVIANVGVNILFTSTQRASILENDFTNDYVTLICETRNLEHACTLKRVMCRIFPNKCDFLEEPFSPIPNCTCHPRKRLM